MPHYFLSVEIENQSSAVPRLAKSTFFFDMGYHADKPDAEAAWKLLGFSVRDCASLNWTAE